MSDQDFSALVAAHARANARLITDVLNIWTRGSTNPDLVSIDFCAADFVLVEVSCS